MNATYILQTVSWNLSSLLAFSTKQNARNGRHHTERIQTWHSFCSTTRSECVKRNVKDKTEAFESGVAVAKVVNIKAQQRLPAKYHPQHNHFKNRHIIVTKFSRDRVCVNDWSYVCNKLSYCHFNVRSLAKNKHKIDTFFSMCNVSPDLIAISETKLKSKCCTNIRIPNYNFVCVDSLINAGGVSL